MPTLRSGERMQRCEHESHAERRSQKYYIVRKYYTEIENHFCQGCLDYMSWLGLVRYEGLDGYIPRADNVTVENLLNIYGEGVKQKV